MESSLRKNLFKVAARTQIERQGIVGLGVLVGAAAVLTALTSPWLAPLWLAGAAAGGVGLGLSGARALLNDTAQVPALARRTVLRHHAPREAPAELLSYIEQAVESAIEIITRVEQTRGEPVYEGLRDVVDTVGFLLDKICAMSERIVATERLFGSIQQQVKRLPGARLQGEDARAFERNLFNLQNSIDAARAQIVDATASLQQIAVQTLMIQAQDAALIDDTTGSLRRLAADQADLLQVRIAAMDEVARSTQAATGRLLGP
ncbi:MAG: hypothetical protein ACRDIB_11210 [Ardenticatenaceae bacterium]